MPAESRFPFTKTRLENLPPPAQGRDTYHDAKTPGLSLRVTTAGVKTFSMLKRVNGKPTRITIGQFPGVTLEQARRQAAKLTGAIAEGDNPAKAKRDRRNAPTLADLWERWLAHAKQHKRTWQEDERKWDKHFAELRSRRLADLSTADVTLWHATLGDEHGRYLANRALALLSAMFSKAHQVGYTGRNPCVGVTKFRESSRERFLQPDELRPFFEALRGEPPHWRDFWLLCLFTGARRGNVASMRWRDLDLDRSMWFLQSEVTKNGSPVVVVLPPPAAAILATRRDDARGSPWVFPADTVTGHIFDPRKSWARVTQAAGIENLRPHDLRRTLGSWQALAGASMQVIGASLGHKDLKATQVYARLTVDPVRESVNQATNAMLAYAKAKGGGHAEP